MEIADSRPVTDTADGIRRIVTEQTVQAAKSKAEAGQNPLKQAKDVQTVPGQPFDAEAGKGTLFNAVA